jgi:hypothetical protein
LTWVQKAFENGNPDEADKSVYWFAETGEHVFRDLSVAIDAAASSHPALKGKYKGGVRMADHTILDEDFPGKGLAYYGFGSNSRSRCVLLSSSI